MEVCAKVDEPEQVLQASRTSQSSYEEICTEEEKRENVWGPGGTNKLAGRDEDTKSEVFPLHANKEVETD